MKALIVLVALTLAAGTASAQTQYTVKFTPPFGASPQVGEFVRVFTNFGFCASCEGCESCGPGTQPDNYQWGLDAESDGCVGGTEWNDFAVGYACVPAPFTDCLYEIVSHPSATCWVLDPCSNCESE